MPAPAVKRRCVVCHAAYTRGESFCSIDGGAVIADGEDDELVGKTVDGRYLIARPLGRGGMGKVYEADHIGLGKRVAVKFVSDADADRDRRSRFRQEARAASKIVHEHVVQIFDVGVDEAGRDYIAMEYIEGRDLEAVVREGPLPPSRAIAIAQQILRGLHVCHTAGLVHRDIKPSNIRLVGDTDIVKIMDFGIAKSIQEAVAQTDTGTGRAIGTPAYMAPEQMLDGIVDHRADLYAVGGTLFAMLAGAAPFSNTSVTRRVQALADGVPRLDSVRDGLPTSLVAAVARALERSPEDRFPDAPAFAHALGECAAIADARLEAVTKPMQYADVREKTSPTTSEASHEMPPARSRRRIWPFAAAAIGVAATGVMIYLVTRPGSEPTPIEPSPGSPVAVAPDSESSPPDAIQVVAADAIVTPVDSAPRPVDTLVRARQPDVPTRACSGEGKNYQCPYISCDCKTRPWSMAFYECEQKQCWTAATGCARVCKSAGGWSGNWRVDKPIDSLDCKAAPPCKAAGKCSARREQPNVNSGELACVRSCRDLGSCRMWGLCTDGPGDTCVAADEADCAASSNCKDLARCHVVGGACVATQQDCESAKACRGIGTCTAVAGRCAVGSAADCERSERCTETGRCAVANNKCVASVEGCAASKVCRTEGRCTVRGEECVK